MIKKQNIFIIVAIFTVAVLALLYFFVILPLTKSDTPTDESNLNYELMYTQTERANIKSIEVKNAHGSYKFIYSNELKTYFIDGHPLTEYDQQLFSQLVVACGYTLSRATVEADAAPDLSVYGLDEASDPAYYILTTKEDVSYKVLVGDMIVTGGGYYARMDGENKVYVLDSTLKATVLASLESYITPTVICPTSSTTYADIKTFELYAGAYMPPDFNIGTDGENKEENTEENGAATASDGDLSNLIVKFHFIKAQEIGVNSNAIYYMDYPGDGVYSVSDYATRVLQQFISYKGSETVILEPDTAALEKYGLVDSKYTLYLINYMTGKDEGGKTIKIPIKNRVSFSDVFTDEKTGESFRYAHSLFFSDDATVYNNLIVKIPEYDCEFLSYDLNHWVDSTLVAINISLISKIEVESKDVDISFNIVGEGSELYAVEPNGHKPQVNNFKKFYQTVVSMTKGGFVDLTAAELETLTADESNITAKLSITMKSGKQFLFCFYSLGQQTYYTVNGEGQFYLETKYVTKVVNDAIRVTRDEIVNVDNSY